MNFNCANNLSFKGIYINEDGMTKETAKNANRIINSIDYSEEISTLDDMGVDVLIVNNKADKTGDSFKLGFIDPENRMFEVAKNPWLSIRNPKSYKDYDKRRTAFRDSLQAVLESARNIIDGSTSRKSGASKIALENFPLRDAMLKNLAPSDKNSLSIEGEEAFDFNTTGTLFDEF